VADPESPAAPVRPLVLIADDDAGVRQFLAAVLGSSVSLSLASDGAAAVSALESAPRLDAVVTDYSMPVADGVAVLRAARRRFPSARLVLMSGDLPLEARREAGALGAWVMEKPLNAQAIARLAAMWSPTPVA
jgi:two-component system response regulator MprA